MPDECPAACAMLPCAPVDARSTGHHQSWSVPRGWRGWADVPDAMFCGADVKFREKCHECFGADCHFDCKMVIDNTMCAVVRIKRVIQVPLVLWWRGAMEREGVQYTSRRRPARMISICGSIRQCQSLSSGRSMTTHNIRDNFIFMAASSLCLPGRGTSSDHLFASHSVVVCIPNSHNHRLLLKQPLPKRSPGLLRLFCLQNMTRDDVASSFLPQTRTQHKIDPLPCVDELRWCRDCQSFNSKRNTTLKCDTQHTTNRAP